MLAKLFMALGQAWWFSVIFDVHSLELNKSHHAMEHAFDLIWLFDLWCSYQSVVARLGRHTAPKLHHHSKVGQWGHADSVGFVTHSKWKKELKTSAWTQRRGHCIFVPFPLTLPSPTVSPVGLKKVRNPDRMYRTAVGYTGHVPPKSVSDDTDNNSKTAGFLFHCIPPNMTTLWYALHPLRPFVCI